MWQDVQQTGKIIVSLGEKNVHFVTAGFILDRNVSCKKMEVQSKQKINRHVLSYSFDGTESVMCESERDQPDIK